VLKSDNSSQEQTVASTQPISYTNAQGQQILIPTQLMRPPNQNFIQFNPNVSSVPTQIQHIPGIGNVQVISASALNGTPYMSQSLVIIINSLQKIL
jgi:hypothetical protein